MTPTNQRDDAVDPTVTVIVATFNRAPMLRRTLESLVRLHTELSDSESFSYEVLVVDNASTDATPEVIGEFASSHRLGSALCVRTVREAEPGVTHARNRGLEEARGRWVAFHDDDQHADPRWLSELLLLTRRRGVRVAGGAVRLELPDGIARDLAPQCRRLLGERVGWDDEAPYSRKRIPGTNNLLLHQSVIDRVGAFDTRLKVGGEDADLYRRIRAAGYEAWYTPRSIVYHVIPAERLENDYMRWTAVRHGQHLALREFRDWGWAGLAGMTVARAGQALINYLPRFLVNTMAFRRERALGARALLWRSGGYLSLAGELLRHGERAHRGGDPRLDFREGRERLMKQGVARAGS